MNWATIILVYVIAWWMVFFAALPFGVRAQSETDEDMVEGSVPSAPSNPNLKKKAIITSIIAVFLTIGYYFLATSDLINFRTN